LAKGREQSTAGEQTKLSFVALSAAVVRAMVRIPNKDYNEK